jgi:hypothetical protein
MLPGIGGIAGLAARAKVLTYRESRVSGLPNVSTYTETSVDFGAADPSRYVVVAVTSEDGGAIVSATIGGVSATILIQVASAPVSVALLLAAVPTGATGTVTVNFTSTSDHHSIDVWSLSGIDSPTPIDTDSTTASGGLTLTSVGQGVVIACIISNDNVTHTWTGATEVSDQSLGGGQAASSSASGTTTSASTVVTPTPSSAPPQRAFVAATF